MTDNDHFIFIGDSIKLPEDMKEVQLTEKYLLKKASPQQVDMIKTDLKFTGNEMFYLLNFESIGQKISPNYEDWNYWIIEHNETGSKFTIKLALLLSTCNLFSLFDKVGKCGRGNHKTGYHNFIIEKLNYDVKEISQADIIEIQEIYGLIEKINKEEDNIYINKALKDFWQLQAIPSDSPFYILAMFSILETLLVPRESSSKGRQLRTKLSKINKRLEHPMNFSEFFGRQNFKTVIYTLYEYRSDIAHGDFTDFNEKLKILVKPDTALIVIRKILKATLKQALKEPQYINDLKNK